VDIGRAIPQLLNDGEVDMVMPGMAAVSALTRKVQVALL